MLRPDCHSFDTREDISLSYGESGLDVKLPSFSQQTEDKDVVWPWMLGPKSFLNIYFYYSTEKQNHPLNHDRIIFLPDSVFFFFPIWQPDNTTVGGCCLERMYSLNDTMKLMGVGALFLNMIVTPWDRLYVSECIQVMFLKSLSSVTRETTQTTTSAPWWLRSNNYIGHGKLRASAPWTVYLQSHQPLDNFITRK